MKIVQLLDDSKKDGRLLINRGRIKIHRKALIMIEAVIGIFRHGWTSFNEI